jgi:NADPH:quinone reductase-like Zn-dependent oxidoreductase
LYIDTTDCCESAGYDVITTCSARSFDHVKSLGASAAFDYKDPECAKKIREHTQDNLTKVFDTISKDSSPQISAAAISSKGGKISCTLPYPEDLGRKDIEVSMVFTLGKQSNRRPSSNVKDNC